MGLLKALLWSFIQLSFYNFILKQICTGKTWKCMQIHTRVKKMTFAFPSLESHIHSVSWIYLPSQECWKMDSSLCIQLQCVRSLIWKAHYPIMGHICTAQLLSHLLLKLCPAIALTITCCQLVHIFLCACIWKHQIASTVSRARLKAHQGKHFKRPGQQPKQLMWGHYQL